MYLTFFAKTRIISIRATEIFVIVAGTGVQPIAWASAVFFVTEVVTISYPIATLYDINSVNINCYHDN